MCTGNEAEKSNFVNGVIASESTDFEVKITAPCEGQSVQYCWQDPLVSTDLTYHQSDKDFQNICGDRIAARDNSNAIFDGSNAGCDTPGDGSNATSLYR